MCKHSSDKELVASKAERDSLKYIQAKYISQFIGQKMQGIVSGVTDFGLFIEVKNTGCEGLIRMKDIPNDFYIYDSKNYCIKGQQSKTIFRIGSLVNIQLRKVNLEKREIDLILI